MKKMNKEKSLKTVNPDLEKLPAILNSLPAGVPIVMINLLKFRDTAFYPEGFEAVPCTGREAYQRYSETAVKKLTEVGGQPIWLGEGLGCVIAPEDECWDEAILVRYPSVEAFLRMLSMPDYQASTVHRTAALEDSRLIATREVAGF